MSSAVRVAVLWNRKRADLSPPLGYPGGPCYLIERILAKKLGKKGDELIQLVELGADLDGPDEKNSHFIYDKHLENKAIRNTQFEWLGLTSHAQYRMDLRGISVQDIRSSLMGFFKEYAKEKSRQSPLWAKWQYEMDSSSEIRWVDKRLNNLVVGFITMTMSRKIPGVLVQTVFYQNEPKPPRVNRKDCVRWERWVEQTPEPTLLEKLFEGKTGSSKVGDLYPPLGYPGGPCQVLERIRDEVPNLKLQDTLVGNVEEGEDLSNSEASKVYSTIVENGLPGTKIKKIHFSAHAQYRMDLRHITIPQIRLSLGNFLKAWQREKSMQSQLSREWEQLFSWGEAIRWVDPKSEISVVFEIRDGTAYIVTSFWNKYYKTPAVDESSCKYDRPLPAEEYFGKKALKSGPEPVKTYVSDKSQDNLPTDIDREIETNLPPGSASPGSGGRDIPRIEYNAPDSGSNISERPRTLGLPGEQYGVPYKEDYNMPTRRTMTASRPEIFWGEELEHFEGDPWELARSVGVNILRDKDFRAGYHVGGEIVAALFDDSSDSNGYSFDIVVSPTFQKLGLGKKLLELALATYSENQEAYGEDYQMRLDVTSPVMEAMLRSRGFKEVGREKGITIMKRRASRFFVRKG